MVKVGSVGMEDMAEVEMLRIDDTAESANIIPSLRTSLFKKYIYHSHNLQQVLVLRGA